MVHSIKKGPLVDDRLMEKIEVQDGSEEKQVIKTWSRRSTILPNLIGHTFAVYDGRRHVLVCVAEDMVDHKLGKFAPTRTFKGYAANDRKTSR